MELKKIELSKIKPYEKNARKNDEAVEYVWLYTGFLNGKRINNQQIKVNNRWVTV